MMTLENEKVFNSPVEVISSIFSQNSDSGWIRNVFSTFSNAIRVEDDIHTIPILNAQSIAKGLIPHNSLVRFSGIVQDMFDPEWYPKYFEHVDPTTGNKVRKPMAFQDSNPDLPDITYSEECETRIPIIISPMPSENNWAFENRMNSSNKSLFKSANRAVSTDSDSGKKGVKRTVDDEEMKDSSFTHNYNSEKNAQNSLPLLSPLTRVDSLPDYHPGVGTRDCSALVRIYGDELSGIRVGEAIEVFGIYTHDPLLTLFLQTGSSCLNCAPHDNPVKKALLSSTDSAVRRKCECETGVKLQDQMDDFGFLDEEIVRHPPPSRVPRLHAIAIRSLAPSYPLMQPTILESSHIDTTDLRFSESDHSSAASISILPYALRDPVAPAGISLTPLHLRPSPNTPRNSSPVDGALHVRSVFHPANSSVLRTRYLASARSASAAAALAVIDGMKNSSSTPLHFVRRSIVSRLSECLGGDSLAAEMLLLHLISLVGTRQDVSVPGKLSLLISGFPDNSVPDESTAVSSMDEKHESKDDSAPKNAENEEENGNEDEDRMQLNPPPVMTPLKEELISRASPPARALYSVLESLLPRSLLIPLSVGTLNGSQLYPQKDVQKNRIVPGLLQVPDGTYVVIDETTMNSGKLESKGLSNLHSLQTLISDQTLLYDFGYHQQTLEVALPTLVLAQRQGLLRCDTRVHLSPTQPLSGDPHFASNPWNNDLLCSARMFVAAARSLPFSFSKDVADVVETDLAALRSANRRIQVDDMHRLLLLARLNASSFGEVELSVNRWKATLEMEKELAARIVTANLDGNSGSQTPLSDRIATPPPHSASPSS